MIKFGDVVTAIYENGDRVKRIYLGELDGRYLLVYGDVDPFMNEEAEAFYCAGGSPLTYWVEEIEEIIIPTIDVGLNYEDLCTLQKVVSENFTLEHEYKDYNGNDAKLVFMSKDEMKQRSK